MSTLPGRNNENVLWCNKTPCKVAAMQQTGLLLYSPPIYFTRKKVKTGDTSGDEANNYKTVTLLVNPEDLESETVKKKVRIFGGDKTPEDWVKWQIKFNKVVQDMPLTCFLRVGLKNYFSQPT